MAYNFDQAIKQAEEQYGVGRGGNNSEWLTSFPIGNTRLRVITAFNVYAQHYKLGGYIGVCVGKDNNCPGCMSGEKPSIKWMGWVLHENKVKIALLPHKVIKNISSFQEDPDYVFDGFPMPYDINITKTSTGSQKQNVEYSVRPAKTATEITQEHKAEIEKANAIEDIIKAIKNKKIKELDGDKNTGEDIRVVPDEAYEATVESIIDQDEELQLDFSQI